MNKGEIIKEMAKAAGVTQIEVNAALEQFIGIIQTEVTNTGRLEIAGLGTFKRVTRAACLRPNPAKPGEKVQQAAHDTVVFKPAPAFKEVLNG